MLAAAAGAPAGPPPPPPAVSSQSNTSTAEAPAGLVGLRLGLGLPLGQELAHKREANGAVRSCCSAAAALRSASVQYPSRWAQGLVAGPSASGSRQAPNQAIADGGQGRGGGGGHLRPLPAPAARPIHIRKKSAREKTKLPKEALETDFRCINFFWASDPPGVCHSAMACSAGGCDGGRWPQVFAIRPFLPPSTCVLSSSGRRAGQSEVNPCWGVCKWR